MSRAVARLVLAAVAVLFVAAGIAPAQTTTETKNFEVIAVQGNDLVVKLPEGTKELTVPDDFRFTVDGQQLSVHDLKPGMKGTATVTTRTTLHPVTVTEVKNGTVRQVSGPTIIVQTAEGYKMFTEGDVDKRGVKIMRNGQPAELSDFRAGDKLSATIITEMPPRVVTEKEVSATLARAESGAASPPAKAHAAPAPSSAAMEPAAEGKHLPKTASPLPLVGLVGLTALLAGAGLTLRRRLAR
jgi:LPXTG-motif cell wall-anchored protein